MIVKNVSSGVVSSGVTVDSGHELVVRSGGEEIGETTLLKGGGMYLAPGGEARGDIDIQHGAWLFGGGYFIDGNITDDGSANGITLSNAQMILSNSGQARNISLDAGGDLFLLSNASRASNVTVNASGTLLIEAGVASGVVVSSGGVETISFGTAENDIVLNGGRLVAEEPYVIQSGTLVTGPLTSAEALSGTLAGITLSSGAVLQLTDVAVQSGATLSGGASGVITVSAGGSALRGSAFEIEDNGYVSGVEVSLFLGVGSGGVAVDTVGYWQSVGVGGLLIAPRLFHSLGVGGGVVSAAMVQSGATLKLVAGIAVRTTISSGGFEIVSGGVDSGARIAGTETAYAGTVINATVSKGSVLRLSRGGDTSINTHVLAGGREGIAGVSELASRTVLSGALAVRAYQFDNGRAFGTVIDVGGYEIVGSGGLDSGSLISSGGHEKVSGGATAYAPTLFDGGSLVVLGSVMSGLTIHGGSATIDGFMSAGQTVKFVGEAGTLKLDNLSAFGAKITGFGGASEIDLGGFAVSGGETAAWSQTGTSGALTVTDGAQSASLTLIGTYTSSDFSFSTDGQGGTVIGITTTPDAPATTRFTQAVAGMESGRGAALATVHAGGTALLGASPLVGVATSGR